mmetsp:Transcript_26877/g.37037  ORF Transcript_26877/g.37037 Transcript_26877/m.37037 type:complete len:90 (-) Transcript_26877:1945-2214(-)
MSFETHHVVHHAESVCGYTQKQPVTTPSRCNFYSMFSSSNAKGGPGRLWTLSHQMRKASLASLDCTLPTGLLQKTRTASSSNAPGDLLA